MDNQKKEITQEVDIIHAEDGYHFRLIEHDTQTNMSLFQCPKCNRYLIAGEYVPPQEQAEINEAKTSGLVETQEPPSDQKRPPAKDRQRQHKTGLT